MATEKTYFMRRAAGQRWHQVTEKMYVAAVLSTADPLTEFCPDGAAVAVVEPEPQCPACRSRMTQDGSRWACPVCEKWF